MRSISRRLLALAVVTGTVALAGPISGASAQTSPFDFSLPQLGGGVSVGGNQIGSAFCVGTNRPSTGGNNGSTSASSCGGTAYQGPHYGQIVLGQPGFGTTVTNSPFTDVTVSYGSVTDNG
jgi:hypothetical protein